MKKQNFFNLIYPPPLRNRLIYSSLALLTMFVIIVAGSMLINGCNKDEEISDHELSYRNSSNTSTSAILSKINFDQDGNILLGSGTSQVTLQHASIEYQREVSDYIFDNLSFSRIDSMKEMFGHPVWELAIIDMSNTNDNNYFITIPLIKSNKYTSYIYFQKFNDKVSAHLITENKIQSILYQTSGDSLFFNKWFFIVTRFEMYNFLLNEKMDEKFHPWLMSTLNNINSSTDLINYRDAEMGSTFCYLCSIGWYCPYHECNGEEDSNSGGSGDNTGSNNGNSGGNVTIPDFNGYFGDDGFGNDWNDGDDFGNGSNAGGNGTYGDSNDSNPKKDLEKKLLCAEEVGDFMVKEEILQLIANNNLSDPCDPTKSAAELLEKALNGYCYAKIGDEPLNLQDAEHFMDAIMDGYDMVITDKSLKNACPQMACIWNNMINGNLGTNYVCNIFSEFNVPIGPVPGWVIQISSEDFSKKTGYDAQSDGFCTTTSDGLIVIKINELNCGKSSDPLNLYETLQHELTHAKIFADLFKKYGYNGVDGSLNYYQAFEKLVISEYGSNATKEQHALMLEKYLKEMVQSLIDITGVGTIEANYNDYVGLILNGFPAEILESCGYTIGVVLDKYNSYQVFAHDHPNIYNNIKKFCP